MSDEFAEKGYATSLQASLNNLIASLIIDTQVAIYSMFTFHDLHVVTSLTTITYVHRRRQALAGDGHGLPGPKILSF